MAIAWIHFGVRISVRKEQIAIVKARALYKSVSMNVMGLRLSAAKRVFNEECVYTHPSPKDTQNLVPRSCFPHLVALISGSRPPFTAGTGRFGLDRETSSFA